MAAPSPAPAAPGECSPEARQALLRDCELSCGKALNVNACLSDKRACQADARNAAQRHHCEDKWERCVFNSGVMPSAWGRCLETCQRKNDSGLCTDAR